MDIPFLDLDRQYDEIREELRGALDRILRHSAFIGGDEVRQFEKEFAEYQQAKHCVGVGNGTDAIEILLECLGLPRGSEIIVPANSFIATSEAVSRAGLSVVFADVDEETFTLDPEDVAARITSRTRAILAVHLYGHPSDMSALSHLAQVRDLILLEDAAQAHGAEWEGKRVGSLADGGAFSFYPGKNLGAFGDAGGILCGDPDRARHMRMLANHGRISKYDHEFEGRNSRLDAIQAAVLRVKLRHLDRWNQHRRMLAKRYCEELSNVSGLIMPREREQARHVYHLFVVRTRRRDELRDYLRDRGISTGIHYPTSLPHLKAYQHHPQYKEPFRAESLSQQVLSLPIGDSITSSQVAQVGEAIRNFFLTDAVPLLRG